MVLVDKIELLKKAHTINVKEVGYTHHCVDYLDVLEAPAISDLISKSALCADIKKQECKPCPYEGTGKCNNCATGSLLKTVTLTETVEADSYIEFCKWVADTVLLEDFEDKWTLGAFAEVACRKLHKLGLVHKDGEYWTTDEASDCEACQNRKTCKDAPIPSRYDCLGYKSDEV